MLQDILKNIMLSIFFTFALQIKVSEATIYEHLLVYGKKKNYRERIRKKNVRKTHTNFKEH